MFVFWGTIRRGKIDSIPGKSHVATMFFHIQFFPLIPLYSVKVSERPGQEEHVAKVPFSFRSWVVAWGKWLLWSSIAFTCIEPLLTPFHLLKRDILSFSLMFAGSIAWCVALYFGLRWLASPARAGYSTDTSDIADSSVQPIAYQPSVRGNQPIVVECSFCRTKMRLRDDMAGRQVRCKSCEQPIDVPFVDKGIEESADEFVSAPSARQAAQGTNLLKWAIGGGAIFVAIFVAIIVAVVTAVGFLNQPAANLPPRQIAQAPRQQLPPQVAQGSPQVPVHNQPAPAQVPLQHSSPISDKQLELLTSGGRSPVKMSEQTKIPTDVTPQNPADIPDLFTEPTLPQPVVPTSKDKEADKPIPDGRPSAPRQGSQRPSPRRRSRGEFAPGRLSMRQERLAAKSESNSKAFKTPVAGGDGGGEFEYGLNGSSMVGVDWRGGTWAGTKVIDSIVPVAASGASKPRFQRVTAPAGYAVGGINVYAPKYVCNMQLVYMKLRDNGTLDPNEQKLSEWLGGEPQGKATSISGNGKRVIGLHGRGTAVVDAIGLLLEP